ncbi:hypothetical protein NC653_040361 [Populus alba x Populus x berolinensis]|uniref:Uncharacterized protein n=1 Tax=Populus alba x Populus x berolinensis TaxID=444605 RepID=A0AAD6LDP9_9ROSI|nr:hypothetical protein NC653_040361 [Populus alba x Populus x berolinensis]
MVTLQKRMMSEENDVVSLVVLCFGESLLYTSEIDSLIKASRRMETLGPWQADNMTVSLLPREVCNIACHYHVNSTCSAPLDMSRTAYLVRI